MLMIGDEALQEMTAHAEEGYPQEVCGLLLGEVATASSLRRVHQAKPARNLDRERAGNRYELDSNDYLHIDADHHYDGAKLDWGLYSPLVDDGGVITLHDTVNFREPCGVPRLIEEIRQDRNYSLLNFPIKYGTAVVRKNPTAAEGRS